MKFLKYISVILVASMVNIAFAQTPAAPEAPSGDAAQNDQVAVQTHQTPVGVVVVETKTVDGKKVVNLSITPKSGTVNKDLITTAAAKVIDSMIFDNMPASSIAAVEAAFAALIGTMGDSSFAATTTPLSMQITTSDSAAQMTTTVGSTTSTVSATSTVADNGVVNTTVNVSSTSTNSDGTQSAPVATVVEIQHNLNGTITGQVTSGGAAGTDGAPATTPAFTFLPGQITNIPTTVDNSTPLVSDEVPDNTQDSSRANP